MDQNQSGPLLLLLTDHQTKFDRLVKALVSDGYRFHQGNMETTPIELLNTETPELAILWFPYSSPEALPELETLISITRSLDKTASLPILLIIDQYGAHWVEPGFRLGVTDVLTRPIHPLVLRRRVHLLLQAKQTEQAMEQMKKSEQTLRDERQRLFNILDLLPAYVILKNPDYSIRFANRTFIHLFGAPGNRKCYEILRGLGAPCETCSSMQEYHTGAPQAGEWMASNNRTYMVYDNPFIDNDGARLTLEIGLDISDRKQAEHAALRAERLAAMGRLLASLAHEIYNPLQAMSANIDLAIDYPISSDEHQTCLHVVRQETERLTKIISDILAFSRPHPEGKQVGRVESIIENALSLARKQLQSANIQTSLHLPAALPDVFVSPHQLEQVCLNLIINASEHMPDGGKLDISVCVENAHIEICFADSGIGISPEILDLIFEPFYTTKVNGTGLGLAVSQKIVQNNGGQITVKSQPGKGSTFRIILPCVEGDE
jgi:signal transduction histidine kinase